MKKVSLIIVAMLIWAGNVFGNTYESAVLYVPGDYATLQEAVDSNPDDNLLIHLAPGTYEGFSTPDNGYNDRQYEIIGSSPKNTTIIGKDDAQNAIRVGLDSTLKISNVTVIYEHTDNDVENAAIFCYAMAKIEMINCIVYSEENAFGFCYAGRCTLTNNIIVGNNEKYPSAIGINIGSAPYVSLTVEKNIFFNFTLAAYRFGTQEHPYPTQMSIVVADNAYSGVYGTKIIDNNPNSPWYDSYKTWPNFIDYQNFDFSLNAESRCIGGAQDGQNIGLLNPDDGGPIVALQDLKAVKTLIFDNTTPEGIITTTGQNIWDLQMNASMFDWGFDWCPIYWLKQLYLDQIVDFLPTKISNAKITGGYFLFNNGCIVTLGDADPITIQEMRFVVQGDAIRFIHGSDGQIWMKAKDNKIFAVGKPINLPNVHYYK